MVADGEAGEYSENNEFEVNGGCCYVAVRWRVEETDVGTVYIVDKERENPVKYDVRVMNWP